MALNIQSRLQLGHHGQDSRIKSIIHFLQSGENAEYSS